MSTQVAGSVLLWVCQHGDGGVAPKEGAIYVHGRHLLARSHESISDEPNTARLGSIRRSKIIREPRFEPPDPGRNAYRDSEYTGSQPRYRVTVSPPAHCRTHYDDYNRA